MIRRIARNSGPDMRKMIDAYKDGIIQGMNTYMYGQLSEKRNTIVYIPDNKDETYVVKIAPSLSEAFPKPISFAYMKKLNYDSITEKLIRFASKNLDTFPEEKMPEEYFQPGNYIDIICEKLKKAGKEDFIKKVECLENEEITKCKDELTEFAKENNLQPQKEFYINKFTEYLNKNPNVSELYAGLDSGQKKVYAEICYTALCFESDSYTDLPTSEVFKRIIKSESEYSIEKFAEIDKGFKEYNEEQKEKTEFELSEEDERDY